MKNNIDVIEKAQKDRLNEALKPFGFTISGGSYDWDADVWSIGINSGYNPDYNKDGVAKALMQALGEEKILLDSQLFTLKGLREREKTALRLRKEQLDKSPKKVSA